MAGARKMGVGKAQYHGILMAIARGPIIGFTCRPYMGIGRQLHHAEGGDRAGESVSLTACTDERIDRLYRIGCGLLGGKGGAGEQAGRDGQTEEATGHEDS